LLQSTRLPDGRTDRQTERILIARPRLHSIPCGKNLQMSLEEAVKLICTSTLKAIMGSPPSDATVVIISTLQILY